MKKLILPLLLALASSLPLSAAPYMWSQTNSYSGTPNFSQTFTFDKFNAVPAGWTVTSVVFTTTLSASDLSVTVSNTSGASITQTGYTLGTDSRFIIIPVGQTNFLSALQSQTFLSIEIGALAANTESGGPYVNGHTNTYTGGQISSFLGEGTYGVKFDAFSANTAAASGGNYQVSNSPGTAFGEVIANFFYAIPEPSTYAMIGSAALMFLALKRRGKDA